ncbi:nucleoporin 43 [Tachypleus tridentatus]|uniref:nucleoporin 43 n=1 Tax=Tachypleus tridentatus TaxID=6853 RepID=UPI003FD5A033
MTEVCVKFVSRKVSKVRWQPIHRDSLQHEKPRIFVSGSWDDEDNAVCMWHCPETIIDGIKIENEDQVKNVEIEPQLLCEIPHHGDVTDLKFLSGDILAAASSTGSLTLFKSHRNQTLKVQHVWEGIHHYLQNPAQCTCITTKKDEICTVGEDGRLVVLNINRKQHSREIDKADSCSLTCVSYLSQHEVIAGNIRGHLKMWDMRSNSDSPSRILLLSGDQVAITCMNQHPSQFHVLATGTEDGSLCIWDMRQESHPVTILNAHATSMMEVCFHPTSPNHLFTSSLDGAVWQWNASGLKTAPLNITGTPRGSGLSTISQTGLGNPWLICDASKHRLEIDSLLPPFVKAINSLDVEATVLVCGTDSEAVYLVTGLNV